jgi:hypothetical protein
VRRAHAGSGLRADVTARGRVATEGRQRRYGRYGIDGRLIQNFQMPFL